MILKVMSKVYYLRSRLRNTSWQNTENTKKYIIPEMILPNSGNIPQQKAQIAKFSLIW